MSKIKKTKKQVIVVPTTQKNTKSKISSSKKTIKPTKNLSKSRSVRCKETTLAYYNCLIDQVANPLNQKVKITQMSSHCRCNKGKVAAAQAEHKAHLVQQLAKSYKTFGE